MKHKGFSLLSKVQASRLELAGFRDVQVRTMSRTQFDELAVSESEEDKTYIVPKRVAMRDFLGQEFSRVYVYVDSTLAPNVLFGVVSTLVSGGQLFVAYGEDCVLPNFFQMVISELKEIECQLQDRTEQEWHSRIFSRQNDLQMQKSRPAPLEFLSSYKTVCITAPRGYGKSSLLGCFAAQLIDKQKPVVLCAPSRASARSVFKRLGCKDVIQFVTPEKLSTVSDVSTVLIDEGANCSQKFLLDNIHRFKRCIIASTSDGYEGQAQGFLLQMKSLSVPVVELSFCWRNATEDFLHQWQQCYTVMRDSLYPMLQNVNEVIYRTVWEFSDLSTKQWIDVVNLFKLAHYRTTPNDLLQLSGNECLFHLALSEDRVIGAIVSQSERIAINPKDVVFGLRRPKGNLLLQSLLVSSGDLEVSLMSAQRILRIAVLPSYQRRGIGRALLSRFESEFDCDLLGASFSSRMQSASFWQANGYTLVNVGLRKSPWLSSSSLTVIKPQTSNAETLVSRLWLSVVDFVSVYRARYQSELVVFHVERCESGQIGTRARLRLALQSVLLGHRDVIYLVPVLMRYVEQAEKSDSLRCAICAFLDEVNLPKSIEQAKEQCEKDLFELLVNKQQKKRIKLVLSDALLSHGLMSWVKAND